MGIVLIGMTNIGDVDCMIHTVEASFRHPEDYSVVIQNVKENNFKEREIKVMEKKEKVEKKKKKKKFTTYKYGVQIKPGEQATISYRWPIYELYEPTDFGFSVVATFEDSVSFVFLFFINIHLVVK